MELIWIPIAMLAALMQAVRTAAQKTLNARMSTWMTTYTRSLFALPWVVVYLLVVLHYEGGGCRTSRRIISGSPSSRRRAR